VTKVILSWSSGKDSAWTLHLLRQQPNIQVAALLTTFNSEANRVAMHAVRRALVEAQAERTGIELWAVELPWPCSNLEYEDRMRGACQRATAEGITAVAFGDLFLPRWRMVRFSPGRLSPVWRRSVSSSSASNWTGAFRASSSRREVHEVAHGKLAVR